MCLHIDTSFLHNSAQQCAEAKSWPLKKGRVSLSSGYDVCTIDAFFSSYTVVDVTTVSNANLYAVLVRSSSYFRVWQEGADCLIAAVGSSLCRETLWQVLARMSESDELVDESECTVTLICGELSVSSDEEENVSDNSCMQHGIRTKSGAAWSRVPLTGKAWHRCWFRGPQ
jgi:hypothetical protein